MLCESQARQPRARITQELGYFPTQWLQHRSLCTIPRALTQEDYALVAPALEMIAALSERIKAEDKRIDAMIEEDYPAAQKLMTIRQSENHRTEPLS